MKLFKIQVNFRGHLRGVSHLQDIKKFYNCFNINIVKDLYPKLYNTQFDYDDFYLEYNLYTYPEINFKPKILEYGKHHFPELYKEYTVEDFYTWLDSYKDTFQFKHIILGNPELLKKETDTLYKEASSLYNDDNEIHRRARYTLEHSKIHSGYQFTKYEKFLNVINDDIDLVIQIRPDLILRYDWNNPQYIRDINTSLCKAIHSRENTIFTNFTTSHHGSLRSGDYYHIGSPANIRKMYSNIQENNIKLIKEFYDLLSMESRFPFITKWIKNTAENVDIERKQLINFPLHCNDGSTETKSLEISDLHIPNNLLYIYVPYNYNFSGAIGYHQIHDNVPHNIPINL